MPVETRARTTAAQGRTQITTTVAGTGQQNIGAQTTTSSEIRAAHTVETSSTKAAVTVTSVQKIHIGMRVSGKIFFESTEFITPSAEDATSESLGPDCA